MNFRKIKLALTVRLINSNHINKSALSAVKELMKEFKGEVGAYLDAKIIRKGALDQKHERSIYVVQFENCTLNLDLIMNVFTKNQYVNGFQLR